MPPSPSRSERCEEIGLGAVLVLENLHPRADLGQAPFQITDHVEVAVGRYSGKPNQRAQCLNGLVEIVVHGLTNNLRG